MTASMLPIEAKQTKSYAETFIVANACKLSILLLLLLVGCLGVGSVWLGFGEDKVDLTKIVSGHQVCSS